MNGFVLGMVFGSIGGLIGAAALGTTFAVYGAVTGHAPMGGGGGGGYYPPSSYPGGGYPGGGYPGGGYPGSSGGPVPPVEAQREADIEAQLEQQVAKGDDLESQIDAELKRQEELLKQIDQEEKTGAAIDPPTSAAPTQAELAAQADPRTAPSAPPERDLPIAIFEEDTRKLPKGTIGNEREITVRRLVLDADRDGNPELVRYVDPKTGVLLYKEEDKDYDGHMDTWTRYDSGLVAEIDRDADGDGKVDEWQIYGPDGRMVRREVDRDADGVKDAFYEFANGALVSERHVDKNGRLERAVYYRDHQLVRAEEDTNHDGAIDTWTYFQTSGGHEVVSRVEKDTGRHGKPDTFETYAQLGGKTVLEKREEDKNGDGTVDVLSLYENGKLKERQILNPELVPL
jgi:antitoxin component YwqK of YwqJK toxin-antitoxin module